MTTVHVTVTTCTVPVASKLWLLNTLDLVDIFPHPVRTTYSNLRTRPCNPKLLVFKRCVHLLVKNLKLFTKALLMTVKFFFLNILKTKCNSVRERAFFTLSRTLLCVVFKIFKKKNFTFIKSAFLNNLRFFTNECTHLLKTSNFGPQGPQNAALQQRYSPC